jgi:hypothetical protein
MPEAPPVVLAAPYTPLDYQIGEEVHCLFRNAPCKVTSWTEAPIAWPRVQPLGQRGGCGLLVNDELVRAIRTESAEALKHWFGASPNVVWRWRKWQNIEQYGTPGSKQLHAIISEKGAAAVRDKQLSDEECDIRSERAKRLGLRPPARWTEKNGAWAKDELIVLGTSPDGQIAELIGRTLAAVTCKRLSLGIPACSGLDGGGVAWTDKEIALLGTDYDEAIAAKIGRTAGAVEQRRGLLKIPPFRDRRQGIQRKRK